MAVKTNIVGGIDLDTGEIVDPSAIEEIVTTIEEIVDISHAPDEAKKSLISVLFPDYRHHFDTATTGFIVIPEITYWKETKISATSSVTLIFKFGKTTLTVSPPYAPAIISHPIKGKSMKISEIIDVDYVIGNTITMQERIAFKATLFFQKKISEMAAAYARILAIYMDEIAVKTKIIVRPYAHLNLQVLMGDSEHERIIIHGEDFLKTNMVAGSAIIAQVAYLHQSMLENKSIDTIIKSISEKFTP